MEDKVGHENVFRYIPGYEGIYSATTDGRIYRHPRENVKSGFLKIRNNTNYSMVPLWTNGKQINHYVHRLVSSTFIDNPSAKPQVNHKNFDKHDNRVENLEWVTYRENWEHARDHGRHKGKMLTEDEKIAVCVLHSKKLYSSEQLAECFDIHRSTVYRHLRNYKKLRLAA